MFRFGSKKKQRGSEGRVGLSLTSDGFTLCHVVRDEEAPPRLELARSISGLTSEERTTALAELVEESHLAGTPCVVVLPGEDYTLRLLDRPQVEEEEIASSLPWLIKDVIEFDVGEAAISHFDFPEDANRGRDPHLFVAAARKSVVDEATQLVSDAGLDCEAIEVAELALRNIGEELPEQVAGSVLLNLGPKSGLLTICHDSKLYFTRSMSTGTSQIDDAMGSEISLDAADDELSDHVRSLLDELLLEIQRSLDYYESELGKAPASRLVIAPSLAEMSTYAPYFTEQLRPVSVEQLDLNTLIDSDVVLGNELQTQILLALGGALRSDAAQQMNLGQLVRHTAAYTTLPLPWVARVFATIVTGLLLVWGFGVQHNGTLATELASAKQRRDVLGAQLTSLENQVLRNSSEDAEVDPLAAVRAERDHGVRRLRALEALAGNQRDGFSKYFVGFAKQRVDELWLNRIEVLDGGASLSIHGRTLSAKRVPQLLRRLRNEPSFEGKTFSLFRLASNDVPGVLDFALESEPEAGGRP
ncbi:MAG: pilus assembly protein PilM [bacterium]|nr:pilus assembly protein PilM [bacterium]